MGEKEREKIIRKIEDEREAIAISSLGNYGVYRSFANIDIPQDITNFRQIQHKVNDATNEKEKQYRYFYAKDKISDEDKKLKKDLLKNGLEVKDFIPTAGIIRISVKGQEEKVDLLVNYPFDTLKEGENLKPIGRGTDRVEAEFRGELLYSEDLRSKSLDEIKIGKGITLKEAQEKLKELFEIEEDIKAKVEKKVGVIDLNDRESVKEVLETLKELKEQDKTTAKMLMLSGFKKEEDFNLTYTAKEIVDVISEKKRFDGKIGKDIKVEFYPTNGIIVAENQNKELYLAFSPERLEWKTSGIGIATQINDFNYKQGNALLTIIQNQETYKLLRQSQFEDLMSDNEKKIFQERKNKLLEKINGKINELHNAENTKEVDEKLINIAYKVKEAIEENNLKKFLNAREELREWRNNKIAEKVGGDRINTSDILKKDFKYSKGEKLFLNWSMDEQRTPLGFYRDLYVAVNTDGRKRYTPEGDVKIQNNEVKLFFSTVPKIKHTNPERGQKDKGTEVGVYSIYKPYAFTVKSFRIETNSYGAEILKFNTSISNAKKKFLEAFKENVIEKRQSPAVFFRSLVRNEEIQAKVRLTDFKVVKNDGFGNYAETYMKSITRTLGALNQEFEALKKEGYNEDRINRIHRLLTEGLKEEINGKQRFVFGLDKIRENVSKLKHGVVFESLIKEVSNAIRNKLDEMKEKFKQNDLEGLKKTVEELSVYNIKPAKELVRELKKYRSNKEIVEESLDREKANFLQEKQLIAKLVRKELTPEERKKLDEITDRNFEKLFIKNLTDNGLLYLSYKIEKEKDKLPHEWKEFKEKLDKEFENRLKASQISESVGLKPSIGLQTLQKLVALQERKALEVEKVSIPKEKEKRELKILVRGGEDNIPVVEKELKTAKGQTPLVFESKQEAEKLKDKISKAFKDMGIENGTVILTPAYKYKDKIVYGIEANVDKDGIKIDVKYTPQRNVLPTFESAMNNIERKIKKELDKALAVKTANEKVENIEEVQKQNAEDRPKGKVENVKAQEVKMEQEQKLEQKEEQKEENKRKRKR